MISLELKNCNTILILFRMAIFGAAQGWGKESPLPIIFHIHPAIMKFRTVIPYLKKIQKLYESYDTPFEFCWHQHFFTGNQ